MSSYHGAAAAVVSKVRHSCLLIGDRVLIRRVCVKREGSVMPSIFCVSTISASEQTTERQLDKQSHSAKL